MANTGSNRPNPRDDVPSRTHPQAPPVAAGGAPCQVVQLPAITSRGPSTALSGDGTTQANALRAVFGQIEDARKAGTSPSADALAQRDALVAQLTSVKPANQ